MRTETETLLTLSEWAKIIGVNPLYLSQLEENVPARSRGACQDATYQYAYQNAEHLSREEIAQAIADAEMTFASLTNYFPAPNFILNEQATWLPGYHSADLYTGRESWLGFKNGFQADYRYIRDLGTQVLTLIDDDVAVSRSDTTGDGYDNQFTATVTVPAGTSADDIRCYFSEDDRLGYELSAMKIRPVDVTVAGTTATITGASYLIVDPALELVEDPQPLDAALASTYVDTIAVYVETVDVSESGQLVWENVNYDCANPPCTVEVTAACFTIRNSRNGYLAYEPATYDEATAQFTRVSGNNTYRRPDRVFVSYRAGYALRNGRMDPWHARVIAYIATAMLPNITCGCSRADQRLNYYRSAPLNETLGALVLDPEQIANPFGLEGRGAIMAYRMMMQRDLIALDWLTPGGP